MLPEIAAALELFAPHLPANTELTIELNGCAFGCKYIYRLTYTSPNSGRTMCMLAKGDNLPTADDELLRYYKLQLVLSPKEAAIEFARIYWREKNARQQMFLANQDGNIRVSDKSAMRDRSNTYGELLG